MNIKRVVTAFGFAAVSTVILMMLLAVICTVSDMSESAAGGAVFAAAAFSVFIWSFISSRGTERGGFIHGGAAGGLYAVCFVLISLLYTQGAMSIPHIAATAAAVIAAGALGGVVGINSGRR